MTFLLYLCKVFLCSGILLGYYWAFLRNKRFHHYNRFYLLGSLVLPAVLPFIRIKIWHQPQNTVNQVVYQTLDVLTVNYGEGDGQLPGNNPTADLFTIDQLLYVVYAAGALALLVLLTRSLLYVRRIARQYPHEVIDGMKFYNTREPGTPFSFFRSVFWNDQLSFNSKEGQQIFRHELFHVRQRHSADVLLAELITALFWWNPFFHIAKKELKAIHEFLADQYAVSNSDRYAYAELLVMQTLQTRNLAFTHRFFQNHIKRRIAMITHLNARKYNYWSRLMVLPVAVLLFCSIALYAQQPAMAAYQPQTANDPHKKVLNVIIDAGHGGIDPGAKSEFTGFAEKDLNLQIAQKIQQLAPGYNVNAIMTRTGDALPGGATKINDGLKARTGITAQTKADLFVSIHVAAADTKPRNGFEVYVTAHNDKTKQGSAQLGSAILQSISSLYTTNPVLLQRNKMNVWVLEQSPCPAVLIECGYITDKKDVEFISNSDNQEALAKKILEGILGYQKQLITKTSTEQSAPVQTTHTGTTAAPVFTHTPVVKQDSSKDMQEAYRTLDSVKIVQQLSRFFNRNIRYPQKAFANYAEGVVYFSMEVKPNGEVVNLNLYREAPAAAKKIYELVTVAYQTVKPTEPATPSAEENRKMFSDEIERVFGKRPIVTDLTIKEPMILYFKAGFHFEKDN